LETLGIFPLAGADETAALSRKLMRLAPPSCDILAIFIALLWGDVLDNAGTLTNFSNSQVLIRSVLVKGRLLYKLSGCDVGLLSLPDCLGCKSDGPSWGGRGGGILKGLPRGSLGYNPWFILLESSPAGHDLLSDE
jgi:hypothetical protein